MTSTQLGAQLRTILAFRPRPSTTTSTSALLTRSTQLPILAHQTSIRNASHAAQGRANGVKNGAGRRLGAKKTGGMSFLSILTISLINGELN